MADVAMSKKGGSVAAVMNFHSEGVTAITQAGLAHKADGGTNSSGAAAGATVSAANRLTYDDPQSRDCVMRFTGEVTVLTTGSAITVQVLKNGSEVVSQIKKPTDNLVAHFDHSCVCPLTIDDYLEIFVANDINANDLIVNTGFQLVVTG